MKNYPENKGLVLFADNFNKQFGPRSGPTNFGPDLDPKCLTLLCIPKIGF